MVNQDLLRWEDDGGAIPVDSETVSEKIICQRMTDYFFVRTNHSSKAIASFFTEDAELTSTTGQISSGRAEIEKSITHKYETIYIKSRTIRRIRSIRFLSPKIAIVTGDVEIESTLSIKEETSLLLKELFFCIWKQVGDEWLITSYHSMPQKEEVLVFVTRE